jgi:outer membrane immunogenic protein
MRLDGVIGGAQLGYNWRVNTNWMLGLEADIQASGEKGSRSYSSDCEGGGGSCSQTQSAQIHWFGTVRPRAGWFYDPTILLYVTGGLAYGNVSASGSVVTSPFVCGGCSWSYAGWSTNVGWTIGGGIEAVVPNYPQWTWRVEYLYLDLGSISGAGHDPAFGSVFAWNANITDNILRFAINYHFP